MSRGRRSTTRETRVGLREQSSLDLAHRSDGDPYVGGGSIGAAGRRASRIGVQARIWRIQQVPRAPAVACARLLRRWMGAGGDGLSCARRGVRAPRGGRIRFRTGYSSPYGECAVEKVRHGMGAASHNDPTFQSEAQGARASPHLGTTYGKTRQARTTVSRYVGTTDTIAAIH